ncbi:MAG: methyltransferase domain-containing protein [Polyangiaceae bacterium]|nr:methyltransferase domain-containing protein [Polyangiaceae bacterium]
MKGQNDGGTQVEVTCPVCRGSDVGRMQSHQVAEPPYTFTLYACHSCGVQHWSPLVHPGPAFYEGEKVLMYRELHEGGKSANDPRFARFFAEFGHLQGVKALDIGCSDGAFLAQMAERRNDVWGIDIDQKALQIARARGLRNVASADIGGFIENARAKGLTFDVVTAFDVIEHLTDPVGTLRELRSILAPNGVLVGTLPNRNRLLVNQMPIDFPPHHFFRYDRPSLETTLVRGGMVPLRIDVFQYNYSTMTAVDYVVKAVKRLRGRSNAAQVGAPAVKGTAARWSRANLGRVLGRLTTPLSFALERPGKRGFKLYFVARADRASQ